MNEEELQTHLAALTARHEADVAAISAAAEGAREAVQSSAVELQTFAGSNGSAPALNGVSAFEDLPAFSPPHSDGFAENALIPDTPLGGAGAGAGAALPAFDDSPLWQN